MTEKKKMTVQQKVMYGIAGLCAAGLIAFVAYGATSTVHAMTERTQDNMQAMNDRAVEIYGEKYAAYLASLRAEEEQRLAEAERERLRELEKHHGISPDGRVAFAGIDNSRIVFDKYGRPVYRIAWGDTLCKLSRAFNYSVDELAEFNKIRNPHLIYAESMLRVPSNLVNDETTLVEGETDVVPADDGFWDNIPEEDRK